VEKRRPVIWHHLVRRLLAITSRQPQTRRRLLDWLRVEYGIEKPSKKLLALTDLDSNTCGTRLVSGGNEFSGTGQGQVSSFPALPDGKAPSHAKGRLAGGPTTDLPG
jgi:hypothetical protein